MSEWYIRQLLAADVECKVMIGGVWCTGALKYEQPRLVWSTSKHELAIRGQTKKLKCIFSGLSVGCINMYYIYSDSRLFRNNCR